MAFFTDSITYDMIVSVMVAMRLLNAATVTYVSCSGWHGPTKWGFTLELFDASCTSGDTETSVGVALSLRARARVASLITSIHHFLPTDGAKSVLGIAWVTEDDAGR